MPSQDSQDPEGFPSQFCHAFNGQLVQKTGFSLDVTDALFSGRGEKFGSSAKRGKVVFFSLKNKKRKEKKENMVKNVCLGSVRT